MEQWRLHLPIDSDGTVYCGSADGFLYALNPDGTRKWRCQMGGGTVTSSPAITSDGTVYCGVANGYLYALNPDGTRKWRYQTGARVASSPTIGPDATVYVGSDDGYLYAFFGNGTLAATPWPKFRHDLRNTGRVAGR